MDGLVTDYISRLTAELGRQPTYEEYSQIMTGFTPEQVPVLSGLPKDPEEDVPPEQMPKVFRNFLVRIFPLLAPAASSPPQPDRV
jgi:hypothetical protein